jgi:predicted nucleotidyltransferase
MRETSWNFAEVRFIDREQVIQDLRQAVAEAKSRFPEIVKVYLFGSLIQGNWTADSDADLIVVVRKDFPEFFDSCRYQIYTKSIPTDSLVYSESEFARLSQDSSSFLAKNLPNALEL